MAVQVEEPELEADEEDGEDEGNYSEESEGEGEEGWTSMLRTVKMTRTSWMR